MITQLLIGITVATTGGYCLGFHAGTFIEQKWPKPKAAKR